jgi:drug/metabolite transporter (DMT)-like permease
VTRIDARAPVRSHGLAWISLGVVYIVWGTTYLAIRVGVRHIPPFAFAGIRYLVAGALLYPFALRSATKSETPRPSFDGRTRGKAWLACGVVGVFLLVGGNGGVTYAETRLPSGLSAVLVATVPIWMIAFSWPLLQKRVGLRAALGIAVGLGGVVLLTGNVTGTGRIDGILIVLGAAASWGFGSVVSHRLPLPRQPMLAAAMEMLVAGVVMLAMAAAGGEFSRLHLSSIPASGWIALAYLIGPGSILAFSAYGYALSHLPISTVSTYAYVNPVVAVVAGIVVLGERLTLLEALGAVVVVTSVLIILNRPPDDPDSPGAEATKGQERPA